MRRPQFLLGLLLALPGPGCGVVVALHPLHSEDVLVHNDNLAGTWAPEPEDPLTKDQVTGTAEITSRGKGEYWVDYQFHKGELHERGLYLAHLVKLGPAHYLDLFPTSGKERTRDEGDLLRVHRFVGVKVEKNTLVIRNIEFDMFLVALEKAGGGLSVEHVDERLVVTSRTPALQDFFRKHGDEVLGTPHVFKRLVGPAGKDRRAGKR
jgi:hypothetical protein